MSEPDSPTRGDLHHHHQHQQLHQSSSQHNADDERDDANNSIIGKVKSRVSSIFPQKLTKWFSPSTTAATTTKTSNGGVGRRRRRNDEAEEEGYQRANNSDDESNNSAEEEEASPASIQPPTKRSRLNVEVTRTNFKDSQSFVSSTPTSGGRRRLTHLNLYGNQKEPAYNFSQTKTTTNTSRSVITTTKNSTVDSADIIEVVPERNLLSTSISSRKSLNIPSTSSTEGYRSLHDLKRQSVSNLRASGVGASPSVSSYTPQRTSTTIIELDDDDDDDDDDGEDDEGQQESTRNQTIVVEEVDDDDDVEVEDDNEESEEIANVTSKKQKFTNGNLVGRSSSVATESGESRSSSAAQIQPRKSGLLNPSNRGLRTLSGNGLNFYSHLVGRKSLFSEKNMPGMLNNSTLSLTSLNRRQFNSSIYGSTSALSDSRLLNTSSPFYKGQTTYGGAAAYNKFNRTLNQSVRLAPTLIRPTSSLSTLSSSTNSLAQGNDQSNSTISSTAKRILELINDFSTPLNDAKKMASNIKTPAMMASRSAAGKRFSEADLATSRSVRLSSVRTPYTRPTVTLNPSNNDCKKLLPPLKELQVPSMSQLLQMKKMQSCTERSRQIANTSKSALNRECEYKLPGEEEGTSGDKNSNKHTTKIKNKVTTSSRVSSKNVNAEDEAPAPANLPNIAFPFMESVPKIDISVKSSVAVPPGKTDFKFGVSTEVKPMNNFSFGVGGNKSAEVVHSTPAPSKPVVNFKFGTTSTPTTPVAASNEFKFSLPLSLSCTPSKGDVTPVNNFKFSSPVVVGGQNKVEKVVSTPTSVTTSVPQLKTGSVLDALKKPTEKEAPSIASATKTPTTSGTSIGSPGASVPILPLTNSLVKNTFGDAFKPKADTWECSICMIRNKKEANECVACNTKKPGTSEGIISVPSTKLQTTDVGFKSLVAQQTASKWECDACMTRNDAERNKCVCCEQAKPGTQVVSDTVPKFSFGTSSASKFTFGFANAGAKKGDELNSEVASKTENKTSFTFGVPAKTDAGVASTINAPVSSSGFVFGVQPVTQSTSSVSVGKDVPDVVKTNATGFKFDVQPVDSSKTDIAPASTAPVSVSFGVKLDAKPSSVKFNLPPTTDENKTNTSAAAITSTSSSAPAPTFFNPVGTSAFGAAPQKAEEKKSNQTETNKATTGFVFGAPTSVAVPAPASTAITTVKPITFGSSSVSAETNKSPPKPMFGYPPNTSVSTSSPGGGFVFGKPVAATATFSKSPPKPSGWTLFSPTSSSTNVASKSTTPIFGSSAATTNVVTAVSSSTTGFVFGKPTTTSLFGVSSTAPSTATTSVFGSKPSSLFPGGAAPSTSTPTSINSSTLATNPASTTAVSSTPFVFGSGAANTSNTSQNSKPLFGSSPFDSGPAATSTTTVASSWPTNTFTFGASKPTEEVKNNATPAPAFGSPASIFGQATPTFGSTQVGEVKPTPAAPSAALTFGASSPSMSLFGSNSTSTSAGDVAVHQPIGNVFGSTSSTPIFGSMSFGTAPPAVAAPAAPTNSNNSTTVTTFGSLGSSTFSSGFGSLAAASSSGSNDGASAPKKAELAFNFGSAQSAGNSGFSFGANNNNKPPAESVYKFTTSSTPSFNFTGSTEGSNSSGAFQFNAVAPAAATNIFAPMPTPGSQASNQQARRKLRTTIRRITPR